MGLIMPTKNENIYNPIFQEFAEITRSLGNSHRLILLEHISQGERSVERLAELTGISVANASQHLQHLKRAGFIQGRRDGKNVLYRLGNGPVQNLLIAIRQYVEFRHNEINSFVSKTFSLRENLESISRKELLHRLNKGNIILLDVRPFEEFRYGHISGAISIPFDELGERLSELSKNLDVVAYCRGPYCILSVNAMKMLRLHGFKATCLEDGFPEWKAAGLDICEDI